MFGENNNKDMNFDSIPNISFDSNGQPVGSPVDNNRQPMGNPIDNNFSNVNGQLNGNSNMGQFIPPSALDSGITGANSSNMQIEVPPDLGDFQGGNNNFKMFICNDCNSTFGVSNGIAVDECIFCHGHSVANANSNGEKIDGFVPFKVSRDTAISAYKSKIMLNPVVPLAFKSSKVINSIKKVYVSGQLYNTLTKGDINFLGVDSTPNGKSKFDVLFNVFVEHDNVFYQGSSKIDDKVFNAVGNYKFNNVNSFNENNIGQCYFLPNDLGKEANDSKLLENCSKHVAAMAKKKVNHQMKKLQANNSNTQIVKSQNIIVPIYMLSVKYNHKNYMYIMNGETEKYSLDAAYGKLEVFLFSVLIGLIVFGVTVLISGLF